MHQPLSTPSHGTPSQSNQPHRHNICPAASLQPLIQLIPSSKKASFFHHWPKVDLHCHLEGAITPRVAQGLFETCEIRLPKSEKEMLFNTKPSETLETFLARFGPVQSLFQNQSIVAETTRQIIQDAAEQNLLHLELRFSPFFIAEKHQLNPIETLNTVVNAGKRAKQDFNISVAFILIADRHVGLDRANQVLDLAIEHPDIQGFDLASDEKNFPPELFQTVFQRAQKAGIKTTCHAGEALGAPSVATTIKMGAKRIGHGVRIIEDTETVKLALKEKIPLEVCLTSNIQTGLYKTIQDHPLRELLELGLDVTLNTDDPGICGITYVSELITAVENFHLSLQELMQMQISSLQHAFVPEQQKKELLTRYDTQVREALNHMCETD